MKKQIKAWFVFRFLKIAGYAEMIFRQPARLPIANTTEAFLPVDNTSLTGGIIVIASAAKRSPRHREIASSLCSFQETLTR